MYTIILNKEAKENARKGFINEKDIIANVQMALLEEELVEEQDISVEFDDVENGREFVVYGRKYKTTVTITHILKDEEIIRV